MSQSQATFIESHVMRRFNVLKKIGSGAYGHVWKVEQKATKRIFALKKIFDAFQHATDAQQILRQLDHTNIIKLYDTMRAENNKDVYLLFEFMEADLHNVISEGILKEVHIRFIIYQMAKALKYMHSGSIIHRDLKPSNILVNSNCTIKLCDFGLVRSLKPTNQNTPVLTQGVATRWYRAPEVLLGSKSYSTPADIWSFGCIIYEILSQKPLFPGNSTIDQVQKICQFTGYPSEQDIVSLESEVSKSMIKEIKVSTNSRPSNFLKDFSPSFTDLLENIIVFNPKKRLTIEQILNHEVVKAFHKPEQETSCNKIISTSVDDNKKLAVEEYRKLVYGVSGHKPKSASLGSSIVTSNSNKFIPPPSKNTLLSSTNTPSQQQSKQASQKPDISKKYSHQKLRTNTNAPLPTYGKTQTLDAKKTQKPILKYVKSAKQFSKNLQNLSSNYLYKKNLDQPNPKIESETLIKEQSSNGIKQQLKKPPSQSAYVGSKMLPITKPCPQNKQTPEGKEEKSSLATSSTWKSFKSPVTTAAFQKDLKQKVGLVKSPKYTTTTNKSETMFKATAVSKIQPSEKPV